MRKINSKHPSSLGLHPAIYFYSKDGKHKPASFWATIELIQYLDKHKKLNWFIDVREKFETFLLKNDYIIQQVVRKHRSASAAYPHITKLYLLVLDSLRSEVSIDNVPHTIKSNSDFAYITSSDLGGEEVTSQDFSRERKSEVFMREALSAALKCKICGGYLHSNSISIDHLKRKEDGGVGSVENGQLTHPYCNTTYKN